MTSRSFTSFTATCVLILAARSAVAEPPKPKKAEGHWSVLSVTVTFKDEQKERKGLLVGTTDYKDSVYYSPHAFKFTDGEKAEGSAWLDTLESIGETSEKGARLVFKDGTNREVQFGKEGSRCIMLATPADGREVIDLDTVKEVKFGAAARKDADGNAMFDHWLFSPFTGEKLTPLKNDKK